MKAFCRYFCYFFLLSLSLKAMDVAQLKEIFSHHYLKGEFSLDRVDVNLPIPMRFEGVFEIKNNQLFIQVRTPLQMNLRLDSTGVFYQTGGDYQRFNGEFDSALFNMAINFDLLSLGQYFSIRPNGDEKYWTVQLVPRQNMGISVIEIDGESFIKSVFVKEANGSSNTLRLSSIKFLD